ncbi:MAG: ATP-binding protein [Bacteroidales bacterium]|nr:ATP-binding protein [Bacteroidales bacterium]
MKKDINPFLVKKYISKSYFCNREEELDLLFRNAKNGIDTTLISPRRLGKTGLIYRFFEHLEEEKSMDFVYVDIYSSRNLSDFIMLLAEAILEKFSIKSSVGKKFMKLLRSFRPLFSFDEITGAPQVQFNFQSVSDQEFTLQKLLQFIDLQSKPVVVAIDEFQQIANYPEKNIEALLRTCIQQLKHVNFIFSGSQKHTLMEMFLSAKRPFYASTQFINLESIQADKYKLFIRQNFEKGKRNISTESIDYLMDWTKGYTFYTQSICNRLYNYRKIDVDIVKKECLQLLNENEPVYFQYRKLITSKQWNFMVALAKEESVSQIYTQEFSRKYDLGAASTIKRILDALLEKEMILESASKDGSSFCVYDVFLMRWLQRTY